MCSTDHERKGAYALFEKKFTVLNKILVYMWWINHEKSNRRCWGYAGMPENVIQNTGAHGSKLVKVIMLN